MLITKRANIFAA